MYKFAFLLLLLMVLICFSCQPKAGSVDIGRPVIAGSPILVMNP